MITINKSIILRQSAMSISTANSADTKYITSCIGEYKFEYSMRNGVLHDDETWAVFVWDNRTDDLVSAHGYQMGIKHDPNKEAPADIYFSGDEVSGWRRFRYGLLHSSRGPAISMIRHPKDPKKWKWECRYFLRGIEVEAVVIDDQITRKALTESWKQGAVPVTWASAYRRDILRRKMHQVHPIEAPGP